MKRFGKKVAVEMTKDLFSKVNTNDDFEVASGFSDLETLLLDTFGDKKSVRDFLEIGAQEVIMDIMFSQYRNKVI